MTDKEIECFVGVLELRQEGLRAYNSVGLQDQIGWQGSKSGQFSERRALLYLFDHTSNVFLFVCFSYCVIMLLYLGTENLFGVTQ